VSRPSSVLLIPALALLPLFNGGVTAWAWAGFAGAAAVAVSLGAFSAARRAGDRPPDPDGPALPAAWWAALIGLAVLQVVPLPVGILGAIAPGRAALVEDARATPLAPVSIHPEGTLLALCWVAILAGVWWVSAREGAVRARAWLWGFLALATLEAGLAAVQYAAKAAGSAAWMPFGLGRLAGTYVNKNGAGSLIAMAVPVTAAILLERLRDWGDAWGAMRGPAVRRLVVTLGGHGGAGWPALALAIQVLGLALTLSRGAMAAGAAGLAVLMAAAGRAWTVAPADRLGEAPDVSATAAARPPARSEAFWIVGPVLLALGVGAWVGLDRLLASWASLTPEQQAARVDWWEAAWNAFRAQPVLGTGLGTFADAFVVHRTGVQPWQHVAHAHNDYAETLASLGIPGGILALAAIVLLGAWIVRSARRGDLAGAGAGAGLAALAMHAFVDFPLAYPANAAWAAALGGVAAARAGIGGRRRPAGVARGAGRWLRGLAGAAAVLAAFIPLALHAARAAAWKPVDEACREVRRSGRLPAWVSAEPPGGGRAAEGDVTIEDLVARAEAEARGWTFRRGEAWRALGTLLRARAGQRDAGARERDHARRRSIEAFEASLRLRPAVGEAWLELASALTSDLRAAGSGLAGSLRARAARAAGRAARLDPCGIRVAVREADLWLRLARTAPAGTDGGDGEDAALSPAACRARAQAAYSRALGLDQPGADVLHLRDAWRRGGSSDFLLGCIPRDRGDRTDRLFRQAAALVAASAPVSEADFILLAWRDWRVEEAGRRLASGDSDAARILGAVFVAKAPGEAAEISEVYRKAAGDAGRSAARGALSVEGGAFRLEGGRVFEADRETAFDFEAGGDVVMEVDGRTRLARPTGMGGNWAYNPCLLLEARIDGVTALQTFLPLGEAAAAVEGRPWAGLIPPPYRVRLRLEPGRHRLTLVFRSFEDVMGGGRPSGVLSGEIVRMTIGRGESGG